MRIRVLPIIIFIAFALIVAKVFDAAIEKGGVSLSGIEIVSQFEAAAEEGTEEDVENVDDMDIPEDGEAVLSPNFSGSGPRELEINNISQMERNILENLSKRREKLEVWKESISLKENILNATEKKIDRKMAELKYLQGKVEKLLSEYEKYEGGKVKRLVKIYENMKPQSSAVILQDMDTEILVRIVANMKEANAAKILAKMRPDRAKEITTKLAKQNQLSLN